MSMAWAEVWAAAMWRAAWQGGAGLLVVWGLCVLIRRGGPWVKCWLWRVGYVKFLTALFVAASIGVPVLPAVRMGPAMKQPTNVAPRVAAAVGGSDARRAVVEAAGETGGAGVDGGSESDVPLHVGASVEAGVATSVTSPKAAPSVAMDSPVKANGPGAGVVLFALWLLGVWLAGVRVMCAGIRTRALRRSAVRVTDGALLGLLGRLAGEVGLRRVPELLVAGDATGPLLTGVIRPAILVPAALAGDGNSEALRLALMHELAHMRRRDILWNVLHCVVEVLFFFHPLIWVGRRQARYWQELACDQLTLTASRATPAAYGQALLGIVALQRVPSPALAGVGVADSARTLRRRIVAMSTFRRSSSRRVVLGALVVSLAAVAGILPWRLVAQTAPAAAVVGTKNGAAPVLRAVFRDDNGFHAILETTVGGVASTSWIQVNDTIAYDNSRIAGITMEGIQVQRGKQEALVTIPLGYSLAGEKASAGGSVIRPGGPLGGVPSAAVGSAVPVREARGPAPFTSGGAVAHWSFDAVDGNGNYPDSVGNQHPALPVDKSEVVVYDGPSGAPFGKAVKLLGPSHPNSYLTIPPLTNIQNSSFTVAAWVNLSSQNFAFVLADWPSMAQSAYAFGFHPFRANPSTAQPTGNITSTEMVGGRGNSDSRRSIIDQKLPDRAIPLNEWHHVVWVWNRHAETLTFYYDGTLWGETKRNPAPPGSNYSTSLDMAVNNLPVRIGSHQLAWAGQPANLTGAIDELWIFNNVLTPIQLRNLREHNDVRGKPAPISAPVSVGVTRIAGPVGPSAYSGSAAAVAAAAEVNDTVVTRSIGIRFCEGGAAGVREQLTQRGYLGQKTKVSVDEKSNAVVLEGTSANIHRVAELIAWWEYAFACGLGGYNGFSGGGGFGGPAREAVKPEDMPATVSELSVTLQEPIIEVVSPLDGRIKMLVREGARVKKGEALFQLDDRDAKAAVDLAGINLKNAELVYKTKLAEAGVASARPQEVEQAQNQMEAAKIQLRMATNALEDRRIVSPIDGVVQTFDVRPDQAVGSGTRLTSVAGIELQFILDLDNETIVTWDVRVGRKLTVVAPHLPLATAEVDFVGVTPPPNSKNRWNNGGHMVRATVVSGDAMERLMSGSVNVLVIPKK